MTDWRELPAGRALDRVIAEKLGWTEIEECEVWVETGDWDGYETRLRGRKTPDSIGNWDTIPQWSTSIDAALTLFPPDGPGIVLRPSILRNEWFAGIFARVSLTGDVVELQPHSVVHAGTPALAISRAFLDWKEKQKAE